jgi:hypothetical protein
MEGTMKDAWEEEKQRLAAAIEREKKLRRDSEMRERRLLDDRLAEALSEGDAGIKVVAAASRCWSSCKRVASRVCNCRAMSKSCRTTCARHKGA